MGRLGNNVVEYNDVVLPVVVIGASRSQPEYLHYSLRDDSDSVCMHVFKCEHVYV